MEEIVSSMRVLIAASSEALVAENEEDDPLVRAMTRVLGWLHKKQDSQHVPEDEKMSTKLCVRRELSQVFLHWHKLQAKSAMSWRLWMLWTQLGCSLDVLRCCDAADAQQSMVQLVMMSRPPRDFPTSKMHCNKQKQVSFVCELWDAVMGKPLHGAPVGVAGKVASQLIELYLHWVKTAMCRYEVAFIANAAASLRVHLQSTPTGNPLLADVWLTFAKVNVRPESITKDAVNTAVSVIVLSALTSIRRKAETMRYLEALGAATTEELSRGPFPPPQGSAAIVAMAMGLASLDDATSPRNSTIQLRSGNATILCQFALLRLMSLKLHSSRLNPSQTILSEYSLRMAETCIEEMVGFFQTSLETYLPLVEAMQSVLPAELFRTKMLDHLKSSADIVQDETLLTSPPQIVVFLEQFYGGMALILDVLSAKYLVRAFLAFSRIEFARESATPPETIFAPMLYSLAMHSMSTNTDIPSGVDVVAGCQTLAVGLVVQRKLRILLFQCTSLIDDALALVFSGLYNVFEPVDAFTHRFLGVCLTHLGQFTPLFTVFPHYLQVTLAAYPVNASPQELTKACGAIFGSLFYSEALTVPTPHDSEIVETAERMVLWAMRKCSERATELVVEEDKLIAEVLAGNPNAKGGEKISGKEAAASETDGLYLAGLIFELMKMTPMPILKSSAMEAELLLARWKSNPRVLRELKGALFPRISQNCEAEKRAWFAAWYIEIDKLYPVDTPVAASRL
ncbi:hypothetical protein PHMEG_00018358 [Phytophthora megakarya]|uniref:Uncharacterized protein n=1 Tax=Phytophthora megakarya TaxID=4795 RepID=A0A225VTZ3_9STRA|nr:hypothetical protein PHMEG_00018358 [Phytophthora megakarya]